MEFIRSQCSWSPAYTLPVTGTVAQAVNYRGSTGLVQFQGSGLSATLQVRHVGSGSYVNWPCRDAADGTQYAAGTSVSSTALKTLEFDARNVSDFQLTSVSGSGLFHFGVSPADPPATSLLGAVGHGKTLQFVTGTVSGDTDIVAAVAGKRIKVYSVSLVSASTTSNTLTMQSNASTALWTCPLQAPSGTVAGISQTVSPPGWLFATVAGQKLTLDLSAAQFVTYNVAYWADDEV